MANVKYRGTGSVASTDFHSVKWTGKTKSGKAVVITMPKAINMGDIDWSMVEKDDIVAQIVFTGVYENTDEASDSNVEPWTIELDGALTGADSIMLGAGIFSIDGTDVALTRGGGQFVTGRVYREINADGDRGAVEGRIVMDEARPTLTLNALTILSGITSLYGGLEVVQ